MTTAPAPAPAPAMHPDRRTVLAALGAAALCACLPASALAQAGAGAEPFPARPVTLIMPNAVGGSSDTEVRLYAARLSSALGQKFIVDFKPGAGGAVGGAYVARSRPDGHTLLAVTGAFTILPEFTRNLGYDPVADFAPVALMSKRYSVLLAHPGFAPRNLTDYLALARARPGSINFGTTGIGSTGHMAGAWMHSASRTEATFVHYAGTGPMLTELLAGRIDVAPAGLPSALPYLRSGKLRALAALQGDRRSELLPDLATAREQGLAGFDSVLWLGLSAPGGTPAAIVERLNAELLRAVQAPEVVSALEAQGSIPVGSSSAQFRQLIVTEIARWKQVVRDAGIRVAD